MRVPNLAQSRQNSFFSVFIALFLKFLVRARPNNKFCLLLYCAKDRLKTSIVLFRNMRLHFLAVVYHPIGPLRKQPSTRIQLQYEKARERDALRTIRDRTIDFFQPIEH